ncbi:MAG: signal peptidase II [Clostridia bacterium]|nr:signal peptidase II [Oscillospiraceae bacterium]MBR4892567.1 signal peptidase II [Clostridia bacterium]
MWIYILITMLIIALDIYTKHLANTVILNKTITVIEGVLSFQHNGGNGGGAWGILNGQRWLLVSITLVVICALIGYLIYIKATNKLLLTSVSFIIGGGIGNLIDRVSVGLVTDFIKFDFINFPIFNVADCFIVIGVILLSYYILFVDGRKEEK